MTKRASLIELIKGAVEGTDPEGWMYLSARSLRPDTPALLHPHDENDGVEETEQLAAAAGFPHEGLETSDLRDIVLVLHRLTEDPTEDQIIRAFDYYLRFDAFLPALDAPDPPPADEIMRQLDQQFFESLGPEKEGTICRRGGCDRGIVDLSLFCATHHFENVWKRPSPA